MPTRKTVTTFPLAAMLAMSALAGCGEGGTADQGSCPSLPATGLLYVVSTGVPSGDDFIGLLGVTSSLGADGCFDDKRALEIEASWIFGKPGEPVVYAASIFGPTITRFDLQSDGTLTKGATVDFSGYGTKGAYLAASAPLYAPDKSYFVDDVNDQVVLWNPTTMQALGTIPLHDEPDGDLPPAPEGSIVVHDGRLLTAVDFSDWMNDSSTYGTHTTLHVIDPVTDTLVSATDDARLTYASPLATGSDGTHYYSPASLIAAYATIAPGRGSPSHVLRVQPGATAFDPAYDLDLSGLVGGRPAGGYTLLDDQTALIRAWHAELADPVTPANWEDVFWTQTGFLWWRWHVGDAQAAQIPNQSPSTLDAAAIKIDGKLYIVRTAADSTTTTLDRIDVQGEFQPGLVVPGQLIGNGVLRVR